MLEFEQQFIMGHCPICNKVPSRYISGASTLQERKFVTNAQDPRKCCCSNCSYSTLTKNIQQNKLKEVIQ